MVTLAVDAATGFGTSGDGTVVEVSDESFETALQTLTDRQTPT
jgi:hypothetical protein